MINEADRRVEYLTDQRVVYLKMVTKEVDSIYELLFELYDDKSVVGELYENKEKELKEQIEKAEKTAEAAQKAVDEMECCNCNCIVMVIEPELDGTYCTELIPVGVKLGYKMYDRIWCYECDECSYCGGHHGEYAGPCKLNYRFI